MLRWHRGGCARKVVDQLVKGSASFISKRLMACLLLVDFCNPVYSARRLRLMDFVPVSGGLQGSSLCCIHSGFFVGKTVSALPRLLVSGGPQKIPTFLLRRMRSGCGPAACNS